MPSIADWKSVLSAARRMSANEKAAIGGRAWPRPLGDPKGVRLGEVYERTSTGWAMASFHEGGACARR
jgi:hypothetical protein